MRYVVEILCNSRCRNSQTMLVKFRVRTIFMDAVRKLRSINDATAVTLMQQEVYRYAA